MQNFLLTYTPIRFFYQSFWRDEAFSVLLARQDVFHLLQFTARDFNPPLYYLFLKFWMAIFGQSEIAVRSLSLVFFWATLYVFFLILNNVLTITFKKAVPYLILFVINPFLLYFAFEARMYMQFAFFTTLSFYFLLTKRKYAYMLAVTLGMYTHYVMALVVLCQLIANPKKPFLKQLLIPAIAYIPWLTLFLTQHTFIKEKFWTLPQPISIFFRIPMILYTGYERELQYYEKRALLFSMVLVATITILRYLGRKNNHRVNNLTQTFFIWAFLPGILVFITSLFSPIFVPRYIIFTSIGLLLLLVVLLEKVSFTIRMLALSVLFLFTMNYNLTQFRERTKTNIRRTIAEIKSISKSTDVLYVASELDFHTAQYYFEPDRVFIYSKTYRELPSYVGKVLITPASIATSLPTYPKKAFILQKDNTYDIQAMY